MYSPHCLNTARHGKMYFVLGLIILLRNAIDGWSILVLSQPLSPPVGGVSWRELLGLGRSSNTVARSRVKAKSSIICYGGEGRQEKERRSEGP
jgi:hypothetical protein